MLPRNIYLRLKLMTSPMVSALLHPAAALSCRATVVAAELYAPHGEHIPWSLPDLHYVSMHRDAFMTYVSVVLESRRLCQQLI